MGFNKKIVKYLFAVTIFAFISVGYAEVPKPVECKPNPCDPNTTNKCEAVGIKKIPVCTCKVGFWHSIANDSITCTPNPCPINNGGCDKATTLCKFVNSKPECLCKDAGKQKKDPNNPMACINK